VAPAVVSSDRARAVLGWEATLPFEDGLTELMDSVDQG
jgi:nucleoside-diphosphate-sugar epimerase